MVHEVGEKPQWVEVRDNLPCLPSHALALFSERSPGPREERTLNCYPEGPCPGHVNKSVEVPTYRPYSTLSKSSIIEPLHCFIREGPLSSQKQEAMSLYAHLNAP